VKIVDESCMNRAASGGFMGGQCLRFARACGMLLAGDRDDLSPAKAVETVLPHQLLGRSPG